MSIEEIDNWLRLGNRVGTFCWAISCHWRCCDTHVCETQWYHGYTCLNFSKVARMEGKKGPTKIEQILKEGQKDRNHRKMMCILYGFPCEIEFSYHESPYNPTRVACDECGEIPHMSVVRNPSHGKSCKMHFLTYFTLPSMLVMLKILCKVKTR